MTRKGGDFLPLSERDCEEIQAAALYILEDIGLSDAPPRLIELAKKAGASLSEAGRLCFPSVLVAKMQKDFARTVTLWGQNTEQHKLVLDKNWTYFGTGGAAPTILDLDDNLYRPSTLKDLYDAARLVDQLDHVHFFSRSLVARDVPDHALDINTAYAALRGTRKHVLVQAQTPAAVQDICSLCHRIAGSARAFEEQPFLSLNINHVVPPLRFSPDAVDVLMEAARAGIPAHINTFGQLGASSPVTMAGALAQTIAETLAGMIAAWLVNPDAQVIFGPRPMITDLRTGGMAGGSGEQALLTACAVQLARAYGFPNSTIAGASDSKIGDAQSGYEKCLSVSLAARAGANLITQACGMQAGLMGCSFASYIIDNDMLGSIGRTLTRPVVSPATLALDQISTVVKGGVGHFLGETATLARMHSDFLYPALADRKAIADWEEEGQPDILTRAKARTVDLLAGYFPEHLAALDKDIRRDFNIYLSLLRPGS